VLIWSLENANIRGQYTTHSSSPLTPLSTAGSSAVKQMRTQNLLKKDKKTSSLVDIYAFGVSDDWDQK
jgi:hypothetical protein